MSVNPYKRRTIEQDGEGPMKSDVNVGTGPEIDLRAFPMWDKYPKNESVYKTNYITIPTSSDATLSSTLLFTVESSNTEAAWYDLDNSFVECTFLNGGDPAKGIFPFFSSLLLFKSCRMTMNGIDVSTNSDRSTCFTQSLASICLTRPETKCPSSNGNTLYSSRSVMETGIQSPPFMPNNVYDWSSTVVNEPFRAKIDTQGGFIIKYKPSSPLFNQPYFVPSNVNIQLVLNKFLPDWSMLVNGSTFTPTIQSINLKLKRVILTNDALAIQHNLLREAEIGGLLKYRAMVTRTTPFFINTGATSFQFALQNIIAPSALMMWFVRTEQTIDGTRNKDIHPFSTGVGSNALCYIKEMYCELGNIRFPKDRFITRTALGNGLWGGSSCEDYNDYLQMVDKTTVNGLQPFLSQDALESGQFQVHFINLSNADAVNHQPLEQVGGSLIVNATLNKPTTTDVTCYLVEIRNTFIHLNTATSQITKGW